MDNPKINIEQILVVGAPSKKRMLRIVNESDYEKGSAAKMGYLFGLIDADLGGQNTKIFDIINEGIARYYHNPLEYDIAFDDLISFLNRRALQIFPDKNIKNDCSIVIGLLKDAKLLFCATGDISSYLLHSQGVKKIFPENSEEMMDVNNKLFGYSLNGEILKNHIIYFCNRAFNSTINPHYLEKIIKTSGAEKTIQGVRDYLIGQDTAEQYAALFVYRSSKNEKHDNLPVSITELFQKEQRTAEHLSPSLISAISRFLKEKSLLANLLNYGAVFTKKIFHFLKKALFFLAFLIFNFFFIITNIRGKRKEKQHILGAHFRGIKFKIVDFYKSLTAISKIIFISIISLVLLLSISVTCGLHRQKIKKLKLSYEKNFDAAEKLYDGADADILFQQKNSAIQKLKTALETLNAIPPEIRDASYNQLQSKIKDNFYKIQNISEVNSPVLITDFSPEENTQIFPPLYIEKNKIDVLSGNELISVDVKNQSIKKTALAVRGLDGGLAYYYPPKTLLYSIQNGKTIQEINTVDLTSDLKEIVLGPDEAIKIFAVYNDAMYALTLAQKHFSIWKHSPSLSGFGKPTLWATDNPPEGATPVSLAVDSNLYILFSNNQIYKYFHGQKTAWKYGAGGVAGGDINYFKIITDENHKNIYLLDKKRISIISKGGEFLAHYLLPSLQNIRDAAIDEASNTIYVLDGKKIYAFTYSL